MIYGLLPVGGEGQRLSLPFSKEMLPQKNYDYYNPIINHSVEKMLLVGADKIYFIHGKKYKSYLKNFFKGKNFIHILQRSKGFSKVLSDFTKAAKPEDQDKIIFGLPDSIFSKNPFIKMLNEDGIVCGLFETQDNSKVDRLDKNKKKFIVKSEKNQNNLNLFWGVLKFDGLNLKKITQDKDSINLPEIGDVLNKYQKKMLDCGQYLDIGTWDNYNRYLQSEEKENIEIEIKYDASEIQERSFVNQLKKSNYKKYIQTDSKDYYFDPNNPRVEFVRYREGDGKDSRSDITIKNFNNSALNRFELELLIDKNTDKDDVLYFLSLLKCKFIFSVRKKCHIFIYSDYTVVFYTFNINGRDYKIIEIELEKANYRLIEDAKSLLKKVNNFDKVSIIKKSKFQIIKNELVKR